MSIGRRPDKSWSALNAETPAKAFASKALSPALVATHFLPRVLRFGRSVFAAPSARQRRR